MPSEQENHSDFASLYRSTVAPLRRYLTRFLGNSNEAQDVAHDAYIRVYPAMENHTAKKPQALLYTTARRLAINRVKRQHHAPIAGSTDHPETAVATGPDVVQQVMARQEWQQLEGAIARLPTGCRSVLLLRKIEQLTHREIAERLGITVSTVEKQHARALRLLREDLAQLTDHAIPAPNTEATP